MRTIKILAPAKINLFLKILNKRRDGYHDIETVFEKISLFDRISIKELPQNKIIIESNSKNLAKLGKGNIIYKAAILVKRKFRIKKGVGVFLEKNIPICAGLGGGSSDAARTLEGLNSLWRLGLSRKELMDVSQDIGSDVSSFILEDSFLVGKGKGNLISSIQGTNKVKLWHVLVVPNFGISTVYAYGLFDKHFLIKSGLRKDKKSYGKLKLTIPNYSVNIITHALLCRDVSLLNYYSYNSFESVVFKCFPNLANLKRKLEAIGGDFFHLSGSGSALFTTVSSRKEAKYLLGKIAKIVGNCRCFTVTTN